MNKQSIEINFCKIPESNPKPNRIPQTKIDLLNHLQKQYKFLCKSLLDIQQGDSDEIDRVPQVLRILFHTTKGRSKGLLSQIDTKIEVLDTCPKISLPLDYDEGILQNRLHSSFHGGIITLTMRPPEMWMLTPSTIPSWIGIKEWWSRLLFEDNGIKFTPKELVRCITDTDGGTLTDPKTS